MGALEKNIITPSEATGLAQEAYDETSGLMILSKALPEVSTNGQTVMRWTPDQPGIERDLMKYRAWDAEVGYGKTTSQTQERYAPLLPLGKKMRITERDIIENGAGNEFVRQRGEEYLVQLGTEAQITMELARLDVFVDARIEVDSNGAKGTWDFMRPRNQQNVAPAKKWSDPTSDPIQDVLDWVKIMKKNHGSVPSAVLTTSGVIDALTTNQTMITLYTQKSLADSVPRISRDQVMSVFAQYAGLTDIRMADLLYQDLCAQNGFLFPGALDDIFPENVFLMFQSFNDTGMGYTASGPTAEAQNPEYGINKSENTGLVGMLLSDNAPVGYDVYVNGSGIPVLERANSTFKAVVL
ncbi:major capsid protein [Bifidobacterium tissieri]|uniref:Major capsid protein E n=1 Tax=Bifidobacterium tissieri TaxID=1630162 RepID=A0A5M9ZPU8_9BIFI|nr:major capsid protein [Bifidobacterium tissieri]KAA8829333.1 major capsid protein E [Bifidobacterium tissieri]KAA8831646.1 major capsid protein E [Bifidobacterium tissieri]